MEESINILYMPFKGLLTKGGLKMVVAAIYGRRSVDDDPSLSVDNQINRAISLCKAKTGAT